MKLDRPVNPPSGAESCLATSGDEVGTRPRISQRQLGILETFDAVAPKVEDWQRRSSYFHNTDIRFLHFLIPPKATILEVGCGIGDLLAALEPSHAVGVDISPKMIEIARARHPGLVFKVLNAEDKEALASISGRFDLILLHDTLGYLDDCVGHLKLLHRFCRPDTRIVIVNHNAHWAPLLRLGEMIGMKMPTPEQNWLATEDIVNMLGLANCEAIRRDWKQLLPRRCLGLGELVNRLIAPLPLIRRLCLRDYVVARPLAGGITSRREDASVTILVPARNERGNIENIVRRMPRFGKHQELIFVEGNSSDGTFEECERVRDAYPCWDIKVFKQQGKGKGDAVRMGFAKASSDILMILDADLTVPAETLPDFYEVIVSGKGEFVNGTRLIYPMRKGAMRRMNWIANRGFSLLFTYLLNQRFTDTLCGTKVLWRRDYERIAANRDYFGEFDPFGDYDLLFGAARFNLKIVEVPVRYAERTYGKPQISRFRDGLLLSRMVFFAWRRLKAI